MTVDGVYNVSVDSPMGEQKAKFKLKTSGNILTGTNESSTGTSEINGTVNGDEFKWEEDVSAPSGKIHITCEGKVRGDRISGVITSSFGDMYFKGTRA